MLINFSLRVFLGRVSQQITTYNIYLYNIIIHIYIYYINGHALLLKHAPNQGQVVSKIKHAFGLVSAICWNDDIKQNHYLSREKNI